MIGSLSSLCPIYIKITWAQATLSEHMHKKFEVNRTKVKGDCQSERKAVEMISYSKMPLVYFILFFLKFPEIRSEILNSLEMEDKIYLLTMMQWILQHKLIWCG